MSSVDIVSRLFLKLALCSYAILGKTAWGISLVVSSQNKVCVLKSKSVNGALNGALLKLSSNLR